MKIFRDQILQHLIARYPYIEYASLFSDQAELLNQPVGHWSEENEENIEIIVGKILYVLQEISDIEREEINQIWLKLEQGQIIVVRCHSDIFLVVKTNNKGFLGELRKVVERTANQIKQCWESEDMFTLYYKENLLETKEISVVPTEQSR